MPYTGGLYSGVRYVPALVNNEEQVQALDEYLQSVVSARKTDSCVSVFMMPSAFYTSDASPVPQVNSIRRPNTVAGHTPRNKKLMTYPYLFLCVDTLNETKNYRYEFSKEDGKINFALYCGMSPDPSVIVTPIHYNGSGADQLNATESVSCSGFPQCAFAIDSYRAWLAQKGVSDTIKIGTSAGMAVASFMTGNVVAGTLGVIGASTMANNALLEATQGSKTRGHLGTSTEVASRTKDVYYKSMSITKEYAEMIDGYFDRYGYATCKLKIPNLSARPHWNYVKTKDCNIDGAIPADDLAKIRGIFDKGITFWKELDEVGNYSLDNSPQVGE